MPEDAASSRVVLISHPDCENHALPGHPERPERLVSVMERLESNGMKSDADFRLASEVTDRDLLGAHPEIHLSRITALAPTRGMVRLDADTYMGPGSLRAAKLAAGAMTEATKLVLAGRNRRAFCATRPPGHHAEVATAMGFCLFNSIAIAANLALDHEGVDRVAILDFDVHHCNGTVDIFRDRPEVLVCSSFQDKLFPYRYLDYRNDHIVPTPLDAGTGSRSFRLAIERSWLPALENHRPDIILISAGFDAHERDPLAQLNLREEDYAWITGLILDVADSFAKGRLVSTLEGGYNLKALANSVEAHLDVLFAG